VAGAEAEGEGVVAGVGDASRVAHGGVVVALDWTEGGDWCLLLLGWGMVVGCRQLLAGSRCHGREI